MAAVAATCCSGCPARIVPGETVPLLATTTSAIREYKRRQRLYRAEELRAALEHAGFAVVGVFARPDGTLFEPTVSPRMWIVGQRWADQDSRPSSARASSAD